MSLFSSGSDQSAAGTIKGYSGGGGGGGHDYHDDGYGHGGGGYGHGHGGGGGGYCMISADQWLGASVIAAAGVAIAGAALGGLFLILRSRGLIGKRRRKREVQFGQQYVWNHTGCIVYLEKYIQICDEDMIYWCLLRCYLTYDLEQKVHEYRYSNFCVKS